jgi:splicing factor 3B subunit 2
VPPSSGLVTPSGLESAVPSGLETPDTIELRKDRGPKELYRVLPQREVATKGFMGSTHTYDVSSALEGIPPPPPPVSGRKKGMGAMGVVTNDTRIEMSLNPEDLEDGLEGEGVRRVYEGVVGARKVEARGEDFSDMVAEHSAKVQSKEKKKVEKSKKDKFKF